MLEAIFNSTVLWWLILLLYLPACLGLIVIVLLQKGKGTGFAGAFGVGGGSDTVFGPRSSKSLPQKITYAAAGVFMVLALLMSTLSGRVGRSSAPSRMAISKARAAKPAPAPATSKAQIMPRRRHSRTAGCRASGAAIASKRAAFPRLASITRPSSKRSSTASAARQASALPV